LEHPGRHALRAARLLQALPDHQHAGSAGGPGWRERAGHGARTRVRNSDALLGPDRIIQLRATEA